MASRPSKERSHSCADPSPFLGAKASGLRYELVSGDDVDFVCLDDRGSFSRVLLGRVAEADGVPLQTFALKIQRDAYREHPPGWSNADVDETWERELAALDPAQGDGVVELLPLPRPFRQSTVGALSFGGSLPSMRCVRIPQGRSACVETTRRCIPWACALTMRVWSAISARQSPLPAPRRTFYKLNSGVPTETQDPFDSVGGRGWAGR